MPKTYCELKVEGNAELIKSFVLGFLEEKGIGEKPVLEEECLVEKDSPIDLITHFFGHHHNTVSVIVETELCNQLASALKRHDKEIRGTVTSVRRLESVSFSFHYKTFSRETEKSLFDLFTHLAEGIHIQDYAPLEKTDPAGKGVEAYAPLHDYEVSAKGTASGGVREVYDLYCKAGHFDVVELGELKLVYGENLV